jgi:hypothetical protein
LTFLVWAKRSALRTCSSVLAIRCFPRIISNLTKLRTLNEIDFSQKENCQDTEVFRHCPFCRCCWLRRWSIRQGTQGIIQSIQQILVAKINIKKNGCRPQFQKPIRLTYSNYCLRQIDPYFRSYIQLTLILPSGWEVSTLKHLTL